ncbi:MAG: tripartite tricarboxylate transporter TctB family protein [Myxococcales bacterium]
MRTGQILMALGVIAFAVAVMVQAAVVGATWVDGQAGAGFFPFWLGVLLVVCGAIVLVQAARTSPGGAKFFHDRTGLMSVVKVTATAAGMLALTYLIGFRLASIAYLFVYLRFIGKHRWPAVIVMSLLIPISGYYLFERVLQVALPRGIFEIPYLE